MTSLTRELEELGGADITAALEEVGLHAFVVDRDGVLRWQNAASRQELGDLVGQRLEDLVASGRTAGPADQLREFLVELVCRGEPAEFTHEVKRTDGRTDVRDVSAAPLRDGHTVVGVFGLSSPARAPGTASSPPEQQLLTDRQLEILRLLADGYSTTQIASELHVTKTTVRNHVANLMARLAVHTRVQAIIAAQRSGLLRPPQSDR